MLSQDFRAIQDTRSRITNVDDVEATTPQQTPSVEDKLTNPKTGEAVHDSRPPTNSKVPVYTTYNTPGYNNHDRINVRFEHTADRIRSNYSHGNLIISKDLPPKRDQHDRVYIPKAFALVTDHIELYKFITNTPPDHRNFYEVIDGSMDQKPRFDLDFPHNKFPNITRDEVYYYLDQTLSAIDRVMTRHNVPYTFSGNCLVFNSHGISNGHYKYSFHIVIDKFVHQASKHGDGVIQNEPIAFYRLVLNELPEHVRDKDFLDSAVYSLFQNFRLLWCEKKSSDRPKILDPITEYVPDHLYDPNDPDELNQRRKDLGLLTASLVSFSSDSQYLPSFIPDVEVQTRNMRVSRNISNVGGVVFSNVMSVVGAPTDITEEQYGLMVDSFERQTYCGQYTIGHDNRNKIALNRKCSGYCPIHQRVHEGVGAYLSLDRYHNIWFNCYRRDAGLRQRGILIGNCYNHIDNAVPLLSNIDDDDDSNDTEVNTHLQLGLYTDEELRLSSIRPNVTADAGSTSEEIRQADISNTPPLEGVNLVDTMKGARVNIRAENGVVAADTSSKHDFLIVPNNGGETGILRENAIISTEHKIVDDNNNNILCQDKGISSAKSSLPTILTFSLSNFLEIILVPSEGGRVTCKDLFISYTNMCKSMGKLPTVDSQQGLTKAIPSTYTKRRVKINGRVETSLVGYQLRDINTLNTSATNTDHVAYLNESIVPQDVTVEPQPVIPNLFENYLRTALVEWRGGYVSCRTLYEMWCGHAYCKRQTRIYSSQRAFTQDLARKYNYKIVKKYVEGRTQSCIRGYIHNHDQAKEKAAKEVREYIHTPKKRKTIPGAIVVEDRVVRSIDAMVEGMEEYVLGIKAACGLEKSTRIIEYIRQHREDMPRILFVTNRVSLADEHLQQLEGLGVNIYYNNKEGLIRDERIICQIDSLYKIVAEEPFDLVVFDEFNSTLQHHVTYVKNKKAVNDNLEAIIRTASKVIIADALLDDRYLYYITALGRDDMVVYEYTHQPHVNKTYSMIENKIELVRLICEDVRRGNRVVVPTNIEGLATSLAEMIRRNNPGIRIGLFTGKVKKSRGSLLGEFAESDVVIYTPTITCGISFVEDVFDKIYGYFSRASCGPTLALQMLFRCRAVNKIRICVEGGRRGDLMCKNRSVTTFCGYRRFFMNNYDCGKGQDLFERSYINGEINGNSAYFNIYTTVHQDICEGYKNYEMELAHFLQEMGVKYVEDDYSEEERIDDDTKDEVHEEIKKELKEIRKSKKEEQVAGIVEAQEIDENTERAIQRSDEKGEEEIRMLRKRRICREYGVESFDAVFAKEAMKSMRTHRNVRVYYEVSKKQYGTAKYQEKLTRAMEIMTGRVEEADDFEFDGDKLTDLKRVYQGRLCEVALNIMELLRIGGERIENMAEYEYETVFNEESGISYDERVEEYVELARGFVEGYFKEEGKIMMLYGNGNYRGIIKRILREAFGTSVNFESNIMKTGFRVIEGKFYPKIGEYRIGEYKREKQVIEYEKDDSVKVYTVEEMTEALRGEAGG